MTAQVRPSTGGGVGPGDTIRIYSKSPAGTQHLPNSAYTKVTLFNTHAGPTAPQGNWAVLYYGDLSGGSTFVWDATNDQIQVLRSCIVQPFVNLDNTALDVAVVDPETGKVNITQPILSYVLRVSNHLAMNDALFAPATPQINSAFGYGGGNMLLPSFPVDAGATLAMYVGVFNCPDGLDLIYADLNLRNIGNIG